MFSSLGLSVKRLITGVEYLTLLANFHSPRLLVAGLTPYATNCWIVRAVAERQKMRARLVKEVQNAIVQLPPDCNPNLAIYALQGSFDWIAGSPSGLLFQPFLKGSSADCSIYV